MQVLVVLDEAYIEFSDERTRMPWVAAVRNLVVLRTFSKSAGLAGLRVGCAPPPAAPAVGYIRREAVFYNPGGVVLSDIRKIVPTNRE